MYSEKELLMFGQLGLSKYIDMMFPSTMYQFAVNKTFLSNLEGPAVESLRKTFDAFNKCNPVRLTKEFDSLINC